MAARLGMMSYGKFYPTLSKREPAGDAWVAREYLSGRTQREISEEIGLSQGAINAAVRRFCEVYSGEGTDLVYGEDRKRLIEAALERYYFLGGESPRMPVVDFAYERAYAVARYEHAWLLRAEGMTLGRIGERLGISNERVRQMIIKFGRRMQRAMRRR